MKNLTALAGFQIERRTGTSIRIPKTLKLIPTNSILARSRIYVIRPSSDLAFAGRSAGSLQSAPNRAGGWVDDAAAQAE